ncbi:MAG: hypothetical protein WKG32_20555 [Gemmatimonadaceae bacterium]
MKRLAIVAVVLAFAACKAKDEAATADSAAMMPAPDTGAMMKMDSAGMMKMDTGMMKMDSMRMKGDTMRKRP